MPDNTRPLDLRQAHLESTILETLSVLRETRALTTRIEALATRHGWTPTAGDPLTWLEQAFETCEACATHKPNGTLILCDDCDPRTASEPTPHITVDGYLSIDHGFQPILSLLKQRGMPEGAAPTAWLNMTLAELAASRDYWCKLAGDTEQALRDAGKPDMMDPSEWIRAHATSLPGVKRLFGLVAHNHPDKPLIEAAATEIERLRNLIDRDRTGLAQACATIAKEIDGYAWLLESRGPYEWDDDRYKDEAGRCMRAVRTIARQALKLSGDRVTAALHGDLPETDRERMGHTIRTLQAERDRLQEQAELREEERRRNLQLREEIQKLRTDLDTLRSEYTSAVKDAGETITHFRTAQKSLQSQFNHWRDKATAYAVDLQQIHAACVAAGMPSGETPAAFIERQAARLNAFQSGTGEHKPHPFRGRHDRDCEACHLPDRHPIHAPEGVSQGSGWWTAESERNDDRVLPPPDRDDARADRSAGTGDARSREGAPEIAPVVPGYIVGPAMTEWPDDLPDGSEWWWTLPDESSFDGKGTRAYRFVARDGKLTSYDRPWTRNEFGFYEFLRDERLYRLFPEPPVGAPDGYRWIGPWQLNAPAESDPRHWCFVLHDGRMHTSRVAWVSSDIRAAWRDGGACRPVEPVMMSCGHPPTDLRSSKSGQTHHCTGCEKDAREDTSDPAPVYIAAPLGAPDEATKAWNIRRAEALALLANTAGHVAIVVHSNCERIYGSDDDPQSRARGLAGSKALVRLVARHPRGEFWCLTRDDSTLSAGCAAELSAWDQRQASVAVGVIGPWSSWRERFADNGLSDLWESLAIAPGDSR